MVQILIVIVLLLLIWKVMQPPKKYKKVSAKEVLDFMEKHRIFEIPSMPGYQANFTKIDRDNHIIMNEETLKYDVKHDMLVFDAGPMKMDIFAIF